MPVPPPLPDLVLDPIVRLALTEDLGRAGDLTTDATIASGTEMSAQIRARKPGILAGMDAAAYALKLVDPSVSLDISIDDGGKLEPGAIIATLSGAARSILTAERTMLNFLGRLSGIATLTGAFVEKVAGTRATIVCTRKTTPGHRAVEKRAVRCGGGTSHRYGLDDAILIKDNHVAACGGVGEAVRRATAFAGHMTRIAVEVDQLDQLDEALQAGAGSVLLDNFSNDDLRAAVERVRDRPITLEASGNVTLDTVRAIAETGVDVISIGALTHSAPNLDVGLDDA